MEFNDILAQYSGHIKIREAKVKKSRKLLDVKVESDRLLSLEQMEAFKIKVDDALSLFTAYKGLTIKVSFSFAAEKEEMLASDESLDVILTAWCENAPAFAPILQKSRLEYEQETLLLKVPSAASELLMHGLNERMLEKCLSENYGLNVNVTITYDDGIKLDMPVVAANELAEIRAKRSRNKQSEQKNNIIFGKLIRKPVMKICDVGEDSGYVTIKGKVISHEERQRKNGGVILSFGVTDNTGSIAVKMFLDKDDENNTLQKLKPAFGGAEELIIYGNYKLDNYTGEMQLSPFSINAQKPVVRMDNAPRKRVELHLHTMFSSMDALLKAEGKTNDAIATAAGWGHKAVAITDHGVVHGFPSAFSASKKAGIKAILGVEGYLIDDCSFGFSPDEIMGGEFVALEIIGNITEQTKQLFKIAACRIKGAEVTAKYECMIQPSIMPTKELIEKYPLDISHFDGALQKNKAIAELADFIGELPVAVSDRKAFGALTENAEQVNVPLSKKHFDTSLMFHYLARDAKNTDLFSALEHYDIETDDSENTAEKRAEWTARLLIRQCAELKDRGIGAVPYMHTAEKAKTKSRGSGAYHIILLAKTAVGLKNMYKLVSYSHLEHFKNVPRIPRSLLMMHREDLIVGSACEAGELFKAVLEKNDEEELSRIASFYDYLEVQPIGNNEFLVRNGTVPDKEGLRALNRHIVELGDKLNKPVVATGDVHFLEPEDSIFRAILMLSKGFEDALQQAPLYFKTTEEMLEEFSYLGAEKAEEIVIDNTNMIADMCQAVPPFLNERGTYAPTFEGADDELRSRALTTANKIYGDPLPEIVGKRLEKELNSIISNGYSSLYLMAQRLVNKSNSDGYLVGSRGSVGSSFVATMAQITEVNPLQAHYVCPKCRHSEFDIPAQVSRCGIDLPDKFCTECGAKYMKLGYEIPFEVFLGFKGDKTPDIDLNFSGEYQPVAHAYVEEMFGEGHAFRAGTISAVKEKTAHGYVKAYGEKISRRFSRVESERLAKGCSGVKRTTGQHPGGIVIVPKEYEIYDFTPVQHPADKSDGNTVTTHFDFHAMDDKLVKLDILGHDDPTMLRMLQDLTGIDPKTIPLNDEETMKIFCSAEPLGISLDELKCTVGTLGIPEFGTSFVRQMLVDTKPTTMEELVRISGLSHGTDVWLGNAQDLVLSGTATLSEVICTRDDIMNYLIGMGCESSMSFKIMESVRKGKGLTPEMEDFMTGNKVPKWFIDSCKKIKYMFPRAHAAAYVMMAFRVAYYKVHHPLEYYATYFTVRADAFDIAEAAGGCDEVLKNIRRLTSKDDMSDKDENTVTVLELVFEMNKRGIELLPLDIYKSRAKQFTIEGNGIRPAFSSIAGVGENAAVSMEAAREGVSEFISIEDFAQRSKANTSTIEVMKEMGVFAGMCETNQLTLIDMMQ